MDAQCKQYITLNGLVVGAHGIDKNQKTLFNTKFTQKGQWMMFPSPRKWKKN